MLTLAVETLIHVPVVIDANCTQVKERLSALLCPAHAGLLHTVLNKMTASTFHNTSANRPAVLQALVIVHVMGRIHVTPRRHIIRIELSRGEPLSPFGV